LELVLEIIEIKQLATSLKQKLNDQILTNELPNELKSRINDFDNAIEYLINLKKLDGEHKISLEDKLQAAKSTLSILDNDRNKLKIEVLSLMVAAEHIMFLQHLKTKELGINLLDLLEKNQFLTSTLLTRALHELTATICYLQKEISKRVDRIERQLEVRKILTEIKNTTNFLEKLYYGSSTPEAKMKHISINNSRQSFKKYLNSEDKIYDLLCDFVHPNFKSNDIFGDGNLFETTLKGNSHKKETLLSQSIIFFNTYIGFIEEFMLTFSGKIILLNASLDKLDNRNIKIANLFRSSKIQKNSSNDGKTIKTAIDLTNSYNGVDQVKMLYQWLADNKLKFLSREPTSNNRISYDKVYTDKGIIYFKLKIHDL
jgi:hypothetical protein